MPTKNQSLNIFILLLVLSSVSVSEIPSGFVYLADVDPTILQSVRYAQPINFVGDVIDGYLAKRIIMTRLAAVALVNVQLQLRNFGYSLLVYDAYRPQKAVNHFLRWVNQPQDYFTKSLFYPTLSKDEFIPDYLAPKSGHSRGSTIDLTIIPLSRNIHELQVKKSQLNDGQKLLYLEDGSQFMCSHFDFIGLCSHHDTNLVTQNCLDKRNLLRQMMERHGFRALQEEWWHYTLIAEPFPDTYFDFDIV